MCGFAGVMDFSGEAVPIERIRRMTETLVHRGPDASGEYTDGPIGIGSRRLAIIDLTPAGHQPMPGSNADTVIVYNGEIYNFPQLRIDLESLGCTFHSRSDTEVLIRAYETWGEACVDRLNGHFAFAIWDRRTRQMFLARDRFGAKPLYYLADGRRFIFGSEVKAILAHPDVSVRVNPQALTEYFTFQNVISDLTLFDGIRLLPPGEFLRVNVDSGRVEQKRYWDYRFAPEPMDSDAADEEMYRLFECAVTRQLVSDVPIASYLSGGIDSSAITAVARKKIGRLSTFTAGFDLSSASGLEMGFDERGHSEALANLLKTEHYEMVLHAGDMEHILPQLIWHLEDLRVGQSYPNFYVARLCSKFVKVVLSGVGGDEIFGGYPWRYYRGAAHRGEAFFHDYYDFWQRLVSDADKPKLFVPEIQRDVKDISTFDLFRGVLSGYDRPIETTEDAINASLYFELRTFLHGLLVVEDKLSMAHSLETRAPFLDNDLVDFGMRVPVSLKLRDINAEPFVDEDEPGKRRRYELRTGDGKMILRRAVQRLVPEQVATRVKQGFSAPDASWFRGESIDYVRGMLLDRKARIYDYLQYDFVSGRIHEHLRGEHNHRLLIWSLLSFEWWLRLFLK